MNPEQKGLFSVISRLEGMSNQFTKTDWKILQFIKNNTSDFVSNSAQSLASQIGTSDASIIRFAQKIGFSGLNELKFVLQSELERDKKVISHDAYSSLLHDYSLIFEELFKKIDPENIDRLRKKALSSKVIHIIGLDLNKHIAEIMAHKLSLLGFNIHKVTNYDTLKVIANFASADDLFIVITLSGNHSTLAANIGKLVEDNSYIVLISNYEKSLCAAYADLVFLIPKTNVLENHNIISREILILTLCDIIFLNFYSEDTDCYNNFQKSASFSETNRTDGFRFF